MIGTALDMKFTEKLSRDDILSGIRRFESDGPQKFRPSVRYDLLFEGKRYPPKAVVGLAAERLLGRALKPSEFNGGEDTACFRVLRELGFEIVSKNVVSGWIFQGNPDQFDIEGYISANEEIFWYVGQEHYIADIRPGQPVFLWMAKGSMGRESGIVASGTILAGPERLPADAASLRFGRIGYDSSEILWRTRLSITARRLGKDLLKSSWCREDPVLRDLRILKQAAGTNYPLNEAQISRLAQVLGRTGEDFDERDSTIALLAYAKTYGRPLSVKPGSPIAEAALLSGRVVSSVYTKVQNFRSLDPRDTRDGLSGGSDTDKAVWARFYDPENAQLKFSELQAAVFTKQVSVSAALKRLEELIQAPDDDTTTAQQAARKIRRGQPRFRRNLLRIHDGRCAVTGTDLECVLEACHISPHAASGTNHTSNGVLLRSDIHDLFDDLLLTFDSEMVIRVAPELRGSEYVKLDGLLLRPRDAAHPIDLHYIQERNEKVSWLKRP